MLALQCVVLGGCFDLGKSRGSWCRTDTIDMPVPQAIAVVESAILKAGMTPERFEPTRVHSSRQSRESAFSSALVGRYALWMVTGAPVVLVATIPLNIVAELVPFGSRDREFFFLLPWSDDVNRELRANCMSIEFNARDLGNGVTECTSTVSALGMASQGRKTRNEIWRVLDDHFVSRRVPRPRDVAPVDSWD